MTPGAANTMARYGLYCPNDYQMFIPGGEETGNHAISNLFSHNRAKAFLYDKGGSLLNCRTPLKIPMRFLK